MTAILRLSLLALAFGSTVHAIDRADTRMLGAPAAHGDRLVFTYDNDLWLSARDGGPARRLTQAPGTEQRPRFSPDGRWLAFSADYHGNVDVYVMPADGGEVRRLTWHPGVDLVRGFAPGGDIVYESQEGPFTTRLGALRTLPVTGGASTRLPVPSGSRAAISPDGKTLAYTPNRDGFAQWKHYRGGAQSRIRLLDLADLSVRDLPKPATGSNDTEPLWLGETLYFASDRDGEFNLYRYDAAANAVAAVTRHVDFPVRTPSATDDGRIVYEQGGYLHRYDPRDGATRRLAVSAASDLIETRPRRISDPKWLKQVNASPDLKRLVASYRGEIVTLPAEKGDPRLLTRSSGAHDQWPVWSPDGRQIAWFSDAGGEYALMLAAQDGRTEPRRYPLRGAGFYDQPVFAPDGRRIAYQDNSQSLWVIDLDSGAQTKVASERSYSPVRAMTAQWSPDSRWLAYTVERTGVIRAVYAWSVARNESIAITDGLSDMVEPVFDANGEFLYVLASTDAGPSRDWFSQINLDARATYALYAITLRSDGPDANAPQSDEVATGDAAPEAKSEAEPKTPTVRIDAERIGDRIVALPTGSGHRRALAAGASGEVYFIDMAAPASAEGESPAGELKRYHRDKRETKTLASGVAEYRLSKDGKRIAWRVGSDWFIAEVADSLPAGKGKVALDKLAVEIDPRAEWAQILDEAWRINRDYFYATNYHGADWPAMREKYRAFLPHLATRNDLDDVLRQMMSELAVGHSFLSPGDNAFAPAKVGVGLLGADFAIEQGRYRFKRILGGLNWNPELRSPLRAPGVRVDEGDFLLAVDGVELRADRSPYAALEGRAGRQVRLRVGPNPDGSGARDVVVVPIDSENALRYRDWVEGNLRYVTEKSGGRLAYVHVPDTAESGHASFKRYFYPQTDRQGLILDERFNGGGLVADYYIDTLRRPFVSRWVLRYGEDLATPRGAIFGPKVMITDETAGSGGDLLPWMFRRFELGPIVGKRTWGGLVGILGYPALVDGGQVTAPNLAIWTERGFEVENEGVAPDIEVEQDPKAVAEGRDPQLDRAIEVALKALDAQPATKPQRPPFPERAR